MHGYVMQDAWSNEIVQDRMMEARLAMVSAVRDLERAGAD